MLALDPVVVDAVWASFAAYLPEHGESNHPLGCLNRPEPSTRTLEAKGGRDVEHMLTGIDELLGEQIAETAGGLDGPGALGEGLGLGEQLGRLLAGRPDRHLGHLAFVAADGHLGVACLVGIDPDDHRHEHLLVG
jgi:hypothetical protein